MTTLWKQDVWVKLAFSELKTGKYKCKIAQSVKGAHKREVKCAEGISSNPHHHMRRHHPKVYATRNALHHADGQRSEIPEAIKPFK